MNRINQLFENKGNRKLLSLYFTAGYPTLDDTLSIAKSCEEAGVDFLEIGFPYSDPVADGPVIQHSSEEALKNGMSLSYLFKQLQDLRKHIKIPVLLMGYVNPMLQYGVERFCADCAAVGIDGVIVPDLPITEYEAHYQAIFDKYELRNIFLITPQTTEDRIRKIDQLSTGFVYMVSSYATTGKNLSISDQTAAYFARVKALNLRSPLVVGFGISDRQSFDLALKYADAAIVGSAFVRLLGQAAYQEKIADFVAGIKGVSEEVVK